MPITSWQTVPVTVPTVAPVVKTLPPLYTAGSGTPAPTVGLIFPS